MSDEFFFLMLLLLGIIQIILLLAILGWHRKVYVFFLWLGSSFFILKEPSSVESKKEKKTLVILGWVRKIYAFFLGLGSLFFILKEPSNVESKKTEGNDDDKKRVPSFFRGDVDNVFKSMWLLKDKFLGVNSTGGVNTCAEAGVNSACGEICTTHSKCSMKTCGAYCSTCEVITEKSPLFSSSDEKIHQESKITEEIWDSEDVSKLSDDEAVAEPTVAMMKEEEAKAVFDVYDENKDGFIDKFELQRVLCGLGFKEGLKVENCRKMILLADNNADGMLDFTEFVNFLKN